jgi:RHS repeat-associated protein
MNYGSANRLVDFNGTAISYDNDGNILNTPLKNNKWGTLTYNSRNMLTDVVTSDGAIEYEYDAENNRTLKTEYGKTTSYVVNPNAELSQVLMSTTNGETTYYIYGLGLIAEEKADTYKTYHYDYRGSTTAITDSNGNVTDRVYYAPYGSIITRTGTTNTPYLYVGKYGVETDDNGLYYMRARYYNPQIQRFINVDPIRDGYNWYGYVRGNSINSSDPIGLLVRSDAEFESYTQYQLINCTIDYLLAKQRNDIEAMQQAEAKANELRKTGIKSNNFARATYDNDSQWIELFIIMGFNKADSLGLKEGSDEYGIAVTGFVVSAIEQKNVQNQGIT